MQTAVVAGEASGVANARMVKQAGLPSGRVMTIFTAQIGGDMCCCVLGGQQAFGDLRGAIVAGEANRRHFGVVKNRWHPSHEIGVTI